MLISMSTLCLCPFLLFFLSSSKRKKHPVQTEVILLHNYQELVLKRGGRNTKVNKCIHFLKEWKSLKISSTCKINVSCTFIKTHHSHHVSAHHSLSPFPHPHMRLYMQGIKTPTQLTWRLATTTGGTGETRVWGGRKWPLPPVWRSYTTDFENFRTTKV